MSCSTITRDGAVGTSYSTSSYVATTVSTQPGSTVATSSPVLVTSCIAGELLCATSTSYSTGQTVLPGSTVTVTRTVPTVVAVVSTAAGSVQTVCDEIPSSTFSSSSPPPSSPTATSTTAPPASPSSSDAPAPSSAETVVTTIITSRISNEPSTSFVRSTLTIPAPSSSPSSLSPSDVNDVAGASRIASTPSSSPSAAQEFITSYRTILVTSIDSSGHTSVWESAVPTLLNAPSHGSKGGTSVGAIAGGVVGGVAALVLAAVVFWLMRKKGYFRRGDEEFEEDVWAPRPHSQFYAAGAGAGGGKSTGGSGSGSDEGGGMSGEEKLDEKEQAIDAATLERHRSWYNSMSWQGHQGSAEGSGGAGGGEDPELLSMEEVYGGMVQHAPTSPAAEAAIAGTGLAAGGPPRRSTSNRLSVYSGSSHSHDGHAAAAGGVGYSPQSFVAPPLPPVPDHRLSLQQGFFQNFAGPGEHHQQQQHHHYQQEERGPSYRSASPPAQLAYLHHGPQRPRSASPPPPLHQSHDYSTHPHPYPHPSPHPHPHRRPSIPTLAAIPPHLRSNSSSSSSAGGVPHRPAPQALQGQGGGHHMRESSSASSVSYYGSTAHGHSHSHSAGVPPTPQRVQTTDSFSSGSSSSVPGTSRPTTSGGSSSSPSASRQITPPSSAGPTAPSTPLGGGGGNNKLDLPSLSPPVPALPVMPSIERLRVDGGGAGGAFPKRPGFDRAASSESFIYVPSQWLGARVVNADEGSLAETVDSSIRQGDEGEEEERLVGEGEGVDSLGLVKGVEREVVGIEATSVRV